MREMKDSGVEWIGEIPKDWDCCKLKQYTKIKSGEYISKDEYQDLGEYSIIGSNGEIGKTDKLNNFEEVITTGRVGTIGTVHLTKKAWITDNVLILETSCILIKYIYYIIPNFDFDFISTGTAQPLITATKLKNQFIPFPKTDTQHRIADYLDRKCSKIDEIIEKESLVIEKLKAYKLSVITEAVTKGLNPDVPMKDSGIEWIGEVPASWNVEKFKNYFELSKGLSITKENLTETGIPVVSYGQIHSKLNVTMEIKNELLRFVPETYLESDQKCLVKQNDLIFADTSEDLDGSGNLVRVNDEKYLFAGYHTIIASPKNRQDSRYLAYLSLTKEWRSQIRCRVSGIKLFSITQKILKQLTIICPTIKEQIVISDYLDLKCTQIDETITKKQATIEKLTAYKKSLIYEVVTGKKEV